jgi:hypothetical protein
LVQLRQFAFLFIFLTMLIAFGCTSGADVSGGGTGGDFTFNDGGAAAGGNAAGGNAAGGNAAGGNAGGAAAGGAVDGGNVPNNLADIQLNLDLQPRQVPNTVTAVRVTGFNSAGTQLLQTADLPLAAQILIEDVDPTVVILVVQFVQGTNVVGTFTQFVQLVANETFPINNPDFFDQLTGTNGLAVGAYTITGASGAVGSGVISGNVTLDGNGNITGGQILKSNPFGTLAGPPATYLSTTYNITGGTYTIDAARNFHADMITDRLADIDWDGRVTVTPAGDAIYTTFFGGDPPTTDYMVGMAKLQKAQTGLSNASLNGPFKVSGSGVIGFTPNSGAQAGDLVFDGAGNLTGTVVGNSATGTYNVAANGDVTGTITIPGISDFSLSGTMAGDGSVMLTAVATPAQFGFQQFVFYAAPLPTETSSNDDLPNQIRYVGLRGGDGSLLADMDITNVDLLGGVITNLQFTKLYADTFTPIFPFPLVREVMGAVVGGSFSVNADGTITGNMLQINLTSGQFCPNRTVMHGIVDGRPNAASQFPTALMIGVR